MSLAVPITWVFETTLFSSCSAEIDVTIYDYLRQQEWRWVISYNLSVTAAGSDAGLGHSDKSLRRIILEAADDVRDHESVSSEAATAGSSISKGRSVESCS